MGAVRCPGKRLCSLHARVGLKDQLAALLRDADSQGGSFGLRDHVRTRTANRQLSEVVLDSPSQRIRVSRSKVLQFVVFRQGRNRGTVVCTFPRVTLDKRSLHSGPRMGLFLLYQIAKTLYLRHYCAERIDKRQDR